jgi:IS30 family transposase
MELALHKHFTVAPNAQVYFCDPQSPWQRGTNENTNRLLHENFSAGTVLSGYAQPELHKTAMQLSQRPRKTLGYHTPTAKLQLSVATTH